MAVPRRKRVLDAKATTMASMTLGLALSGAAWAQGSETRATAISHVHASIAAGELDAELTRISRELLRISNGKPDLAQLYLIMRDACETAMENFASPASGEVPKALRGNYCTCDALLTIDDWLKNSDMKQSLVDFSAAPNAAGAKLLLANHRIYEHDPVCGAALRGAE